MKSYKSGYIQKQDSFKSFQPSFINKSWVIDDMELLHLLSKADRQLGRLDSFSEYVPNIDLFISMHLLKEATQSSKIEGTQTNIEEALLEKEDIHPEKRDDWEEVHNYIEAINEAVDRLQELPFSSRLIKLTHKILLKGVRGHYKNPGEFRRSQNWIGGATINDAVFVPPVHDTIQELMSDLEKFAHNDEIHLPDLLKIALIHYQFETIHPFLDGNGRIGRLLITLYLVEKGILRKPVLYLSDFFERHKQLYYDNLTNVRTQDNLKQWFKFFLVGIYETAKSGVETFDAILKLKQDVEVKIQVNSKRAQYLLQLMDSLYKNPMLNQQRVSALTGVSKGTAYRLIDELVSLNVLVETTGSSRGRIYIFEDYVNLFKNVNR